jgi:DNA repair exonuclease SbcCD ATPase subunit
MNALKLNESVNPRKGCLGRLEGICADFKNATRNGRLYPLELWKHVFEDPIFKESLETKTLLGELDHPEDRLEVLAGEACIVMTDYRIDEDEGVIYAGFDILDTPRGRILKTLLDYGSVLGVSSRGQGDIINTPEGEKVDPDTYDFACFDAVLTPAVEKARQSVVESTAKTKVKKFTESIKKQIEEAETIGDLNAIKKVVEVTQSAEADSLLESIQNKCNVIKDGKTITSNEETMQDTPNNATKETVLECVSTVEETSANTIRDNRELFSCLNNMRKQVAAYKFRESKILKVVESRDKSIAKLQKELDVLKSVKTTNNRLQKENVNLINANKAKVMNLESVISVQDEKVQKLHNCIKEQKQVIDSLNTKLLESHKKLNSSTDTINKLEKIVSKKNDTILSLKETINTNKTEISDLQDETRNYTDQLTECQNTITELENNVSALNEQLESLQSDITITEQESDTNSKRMELEINSYSGLVDELHGKVKNLEAKLNESTTAKNKQSAKIKHLVEQLGMYQHNYVNTKSRQLGVDPAMVQKYITEDTTVTQINKLVEDLQKTKDRYAKLPISEQTPKGVSINPDNIKTSTPEEDKLAMFIENVARG